ncbi:MAG TPA: 4-(cytidine 5'-diphospho)-2-C-methyl-D-erythritol kinase, partial [Bacteroidota bacterium]|nr:4-(cytidine 5'-diphospho)-2-C-methyl-D-erythritol kinase [Bacteroidota bacterium]
MSLDPPDITLRAYAKLNLGLLVLEKRPDGFHEISTIFHRIDLADDIEIRRDKAIRVISSDE